MGGVLSVTNEQKLLAQQLFEQLVKEADVAKAEKAVERRQPNAVQRYIRETIGELKKVNWPTRQEAVNLTIVVLIVTLSMSAFLGLLDFIFTKLFALILG
jgi:preprotein translocase subunit SecE